MCQNPICYVDPQMRMAYLNLPGGRSKLDPWSEWLNSATEFLNAARWWTQAGARNRRLGALSAAICARNFQPWGGRDRDGRSWSGISGSRDLMSKSNLSRKVILSMSAATLVALIVMSCGYVFYLDHYDWFFPTSREAEDAWDAAWDSSDFITLGLLATIGLIAVGMVGWRMSRWIVQPLKQVAEAARLIAAGNFSARAPGPESGFSEADSLIGDFNTMASRLERAEAEVRYSNSAIAHELRTPLTILKGRLQGLADGLYAPSPALYDSLISHVNSLSRLVEDLRTLGLANAGYLDLHLETINLAEEVAAAVGAIEPELTAAGSVVVREFQPVHAEVDRTRIRQALMAILDNALRYAPKSKIRVETFVAGSFAVIRCSDTGPGLPPGSCDKVFERFWRADDSRSRSTGGTGLGLSIVRAIARAHGGDAVAHSRVGFGVAIEISLPLDRAKLDGSANRENRIFVPPDDRRGGLSGQRIEMTQD